MQRVVRDKTRNLCRGAISSKKEGDVDHLGINVIAKNKFTSGEEGNGVRRTSGLDFICVIRIETLSSVQKTKRNVQFPQRLKQKLHRDLDWRSRRGKKRFRPIPRRKMG